MLLLLSLACQPPVPPALSAAPARTLSVSGTADLDVAPDEASVTFTFAARAKRMKDAHATTQAQIDAFLANVATIGVPKEGVNLAGITYQPNYTYPDYGPPRVDSFTASEQIVVKTRDFAQIPVLVDAAAEGGVSRVGNVEFRSTKLPELKKSARDMAIAATKEKAAQLAEGLGAKLGPVQTIEEQLGDAYTGNEQQYLGNAVAQRSASYGTVSGDDMGAITPGTERLRLSIRAVYALE